MRWVITAHQFLLRDPGEVVNSSSNTELWSLRCCWFLMSQQTPTNRIIYCKCSFLKASWTLKRNSVPWILSCLKHLFGQASGHPHLLAKLEGKAELWFHFVVLQFPSMRGRTNSSFKIFRYFNSIGDIEWIMFAFSSLKTITQYFHFQKFFKKGVF